MRAKVQREHPKATVKAKLGPGKAPKTQPAVKAAYREAVAQEGLERRAERKKPARHTNKDTKERKMADQQQHQEQKPKQEANDKAKGEKKDEQGQPVVQEEAGFLNETPKEAPKPLKVKVGPKGEVEEQAIDPTTIGNLTDVTAFLGIGGQSVTTVTTYRYATTEVTDILAGGSHYLIKKRQGLLEVGGTADWGTGTAVGGGR